MQLLQLGGLMACLPARTQIAHVGVSSHLLKLKIFAERKVATGFFFSPPLLLILLGQRKTYKQSSL